MSGIPLAELIPSAAALLVGGVVAGLLAGLFGVGGGVIAVPVLYEVFRVLGVPDALRMQLCIGTDSGWNLLLFLRVLCGEAFPGLPPRPRRSLR